jgi:hypothetical protein
MERNKGTDVKTRIRMKRILTVVIVVLSLMGLGILAFNIWNVNVHSMETFDENSEVSEVFNTKWGRTSSFYVFNKDGKRGYISAETGKEVVKPIYKRAWIDDMETGLAACVNGDYKLGFINAKTGETVIPFQFDFDVDYNTGRYDQPVFDYVFCNGICIVPGEGGKLGMIDKTGKLLLPIEYVDIINWRDKNTPNIILKKYADEDSDYEYIYGVCDRNFNMIVPFEYNEFKKNIDYDVHLKNYIVKKDGKYGILDTLFNLILPIKYNSITLPYESNFYIVELNDKYGVIDSNFRMVLPVEYDWIGTQLSNYIAKKDDVQKLYDERGKIINDFYIEDDGESDEDVFQSVFEPEQSKLTAYIQYYLDGYYGIIDVNKNVVIPAKYDRIKYLGNGNFACKQNGYSFIIKDKKYSNQ